MGSFLRFALFTTALVTLLVFVVVPLAAGALLGSLATDVGIGGTNVNVSVDTLGPGIFTGRAQSVNLSGNNVSVPHGVVGHLDVTLGDVSLSDYTFSTVSGRLTNVTLNAPGGSVLVQNVDLSGPSNRTRATGTVSSAEARKLVKQVAATVGVKVDSVQLTDAGVTLISGGTRTSATLAITDAALVLIRPGALPTVLFAPAPSDAWQLASVSVSSDGIQLGLNVDAARLARALGGRSMASH